MTSGLSNLHLKYLDICLNVPLSFFKLTVVAKIENINLGETTVESLFLLPLFCFQNYVQGIQKRTGICDVNCKILGRKGTVYWTFPHFKAHPSSLLIRYFKMHVELCSPITFLAFKI